MFTIYCHRDRHDDCTGHGGLTRESRFECECACHDHDPSGRLCALAGRKLAGHDVDDYCRTCYEDAKIGLDNLWP